jgi:hypothetical protein
VYFVQSDLRVFNRFYVTESCPVSLCVFIAPLHTDDARVGKLDERGANG